jgi:NitT/TauT family transport system substrate-binding protein
VAGLRQGLRQGTAVRPLRIGHLSTFYHTAVLLMADDRTAAKLGRAVEWKLFGTGPAIVDAFEKGGLDLAYIGLPPAIIGMDRGVSLRCVAGGHIEGTVFSGKTKYAGFPEMKDLGQVLGQFRGMKLGVPGKGSIHDVILSDCLDRFHLRNEVEVVNFQWADLATEAVVKEEVAAAIGTPALAVAVKRFAGGRVLYPPSLLWPHNPSYGIVAGERLIREEPGTIEAFLELHEAATALLRNEPAEASRIISGYVGFIDAGFVHDTLMLSPKYCAQLSDEYMASTMKFVGAMRKLGYIRGDIAATAIFDTSFIARVHPEGHHYGV